MSWPTCNESSCFADDAEADEVESAALATLLAPTRSVLSQTRPKPAADATPSIAAIREEDGKAESEVARAAKLAAASAAATAKLAALTQPPPRKVARWGAPVGIATPGAALLPSPVMVGGPQLATRGRPAVPKPGSAVMASAAFAAALAAANAAAATAAPRGSAAAGTAPAGAGSGTSGAGASGGAGAEAAEGGLGATAAAAAAAGDTSSGGVAGSAAAGYGAAPESVAKTSRRTRWSNS